MVNNEQNLINAVKERTLTQLDYFLLTQIYLFLKFLNKMITLFCQEIRNNVKDLFKSNQVATLLFRIFQMPDVVNIFTDKTSTFQIS